MTEEISEKLHTSSERDKFLRQRSTMAQELCSRVQEASAVAVDALTGVMKNGADTDKIKASAVVLNIASKIRLDAGLPQDLGSSDWLPPVKSIVEKRFAIHAYERVNPEASDRAMSAALGIDIEELTAIRNQLAAIEK